MSHKCEIPLWLFHKGNMRGLFSWPHSLSPRCLGRVAWHAQALVVRKIGQQPFVAPVWDYMVSDCRKGLPTMAKAFLAEIEVARQALAPALLVSVSVDVRGAIDLLAERFRWVWHVTLCGRPVARCSRLPIRCIS